MLVAASALAEHARGCIADDARPFVATQLTATHEGEATATAQRPLQVCEAAHRPSDCPARPSFGRSGAPRPRTSTARAGPFAFADAERAGAILIAAGFDELHFSPLEQLVCLGSNVADAVEFFVRTDGRKLERAVGRDALMRVVGALERELSARASRDGVWLGSSSWVVTARAAARG